MGFSESAITHAQWLRETWQIDFTPRLIELLPRDPSPHRTRRIRRLSAAFDVTGDAVRVLAPEAAYPRKFLSRAGYTNVPDREAQLAFRTRWASEATVDL